MTILRMCVAASVLIGSSTMAQAGLFDGLMHGGAKCDGCGPDSCAPECCKPTITRPCGRTVHTYQRKCSTLKPPSCCDDNGCCDSGCGMTGCHPISACDPVCAAPVCDGACTDACGNGNCCDADDSCCVPNECCDYDPCKLAALIYESMTACYAKDRKAAVHKLGDKFDCNCNPEIMVAFIYALNDADERVREKAADEIGDQIRKNACCCSAQVVTALTCALGDCDRGVRKQAEQALKLCGYDVVDGHCDVDCCDVGCGDACAVNTTAPATIDSVAPAAPIAPTTAPAPPAEEEVRAYFPKRLPAAADAAPVKNNTLASILGF